MDTCKAAVFVGANRPLEIQEFPVLPMEPGGALVRMQMAAICGTDVHASHLEATPAPTIFGHENLGVLAEVSPEITTDVMGQPLRPGDRVIFPGCSVRQVLPVRAGRAMREVPAPTAWPVRTGSRTCRAGLASTSSLPLLPGYCACPTTYPTSAPC